MGRLVSIVLATYNSERYLREQLDSLYSQTYRNIEVVVSDDNSTDGTVAILAEYARKHGLRYSINSRNTGFVKNFQKAITMCSGELVALCDHDDVWFPEKIETLVAAIDDFSMVCCDATVIDSKGELAAFSLYKHAGRKFFHEEQFIHLLYGNYITGCTTLFKKQILENALPFPDSIPYHDWWLAIIAAAGNGIAFVDRPLMGYRYHGANQSETAKKNKFEFIINRIAQVRKMKKSDSYDNAIVYLSDLENRIPMDKKKAVADRIAFYIDIKESLIHFRAFKTAFRYRDYMFAGRNRFSRYIYIAGSLFA